MYIIKNAYKNNQMKTFPHEKIHLYDIFEKFLEQSAIKEEKILLFQNMIWGRNLHN